MSFSIYIPELIWVTRMKGRGDAAVDWPKAKNILIVALLATNLFLIWAIFTAQKTVPLDMEIIDQTVSILEQNDIEVYCPVPTEQRKISVLSVLYDDMDGIFEYQVTENPLSQPLTENDAIQTAETFLVDKSLFTENTVLFSVSAPIEGVFQVKFKNIVDDIEIEGCYATCTVTKDGVTKLDRYWLVPSGYGKNKREIIPAATALLSFMTDFQEQGKKTITNIALVYKVDSPYSKDDEASSDTAFPMWRITTSDGKKSYYNAFDL